MSVPAHMDPYVAKVAEREAANRDRAIQRIEQSRQFQLAVALEQYQARVATIDKSAAAAREIEFRTFESIQDGAVNFVQTRSDRKLAAQVGLALPFLHSLNRFGRPSLLAKSGGEQ